MNPCFALIQNLVNGHTDPMAPLLLLHLMGELGDNRKQVSLSEAARIFNSNRQTISKVLVTLANQGLIELEKPEIKTEKKRKLNPQKYYISICYNKIIDKYKTEKKLNEKRKNSPCDTAQVLTMPTVTNAAESEKKAQKVITGEMVQELIAVFCSCYKERFNFNPVIDGKESGAARNLIKTLGSVTKAGTFVEHYLRMPMRTERNTYLSWIKPNEVKKFMLDGTVVTNINDRQTELNIHNSQVLNRAMERYAAPTPPPRRTTVHESAAAADFDF
jgi:hypothetical protein